MKIEEPPISRLLSRLDGVKPTGPDRYAALCPAHDDKSPSLSVRVADDGRVLIHCFTGCPTSDILAAIGLEYRDLFVPDPSRRAPAHRRAHLTAAQRAAREHARWLLRIAAADLARGVGISSADRASIAQAVSLLTGTAQEDARV